MKEVLLKWNEEPEESGENCWDASILRLLLTNRFKSVKGIVVKALAKTDDEIKLKDKLMHELSKQRKDLLESLKSKKRIEIGFATMQCRQKQERDRDPKSKIRLGIER